MRITKLFKNIEDKKTEKEKNKELYDLSLRVLNEDQNTFNRIDEKASKYLSVFTILIGAYGFFGKWILDKFIPPNSLAEILLIILFILIFIILYYSWFTVFKILRAMERHKTPFNFKTIKFFNDNNLKDIYYKLSKRNSEAFEKNLEITRKKAALLRKGHNLINITVALILIFTIMFGWSVYKIKSDNQKYYERRLVMTEKQNDKPQQENEETTSSKQNIQVEPPDNIVINEATRPSWMKIKKEDIGKKGENKKD